MIFNRRIGGRNLYSEKSQLFPSNNPIFFFLHRLILNRNYINVYMKWKKDSYLDSIESIHRSLELKTVIALKNWILQASPQDCSIPVSDVSKKGLQLGIPFKVARFLRKYPSFFEEFKGPKYDLPWFRLTQKAIAIDQEENEAYRKFKLELIDRLRKVILMSIGDKKVLPLRIIKGLLWNLGLPVDFLSEDNLNGILTFVDTEDGEKGLCVENYGNNERVFSVLQMNAMKRGVYVGHEMEEIAFPLFPSKGVRLKRKISEWSDKFQKLPYISPYEEFSSLNTNSDLSEKRIVGMLHELLSLFVDHAAERKTFLCLRKFLGFPQKVHKAFERHPYMFYLSLRSNTCTAILKEAYYDRTAIEPHPLADVRKKYIQLLLQSAVILRNRRMSSRVCSHDDVMNDKDLDGLDNEGNKLMTV